MARRRSYALISTGSPLAATPDRRGVVQFAGTVYRAHNPKWSWSPLSGEGARKHGGRFNRMGQPTLYTSLSPSTAMLEASPLGRPFQPLTLIAYRVDADPLFDATDLQAVASLGFSPADLADPLWEDRLLDGQEPVQHRFVAAVRAIGAVGMLVRSFARGAVDLNRNLVLWHWNEDGGAGVEVIDDEDRLPRDGSSWGL